MRIKKAEFITSAVDSSVWPTTGLPQVAMLGRSNVGKSSLINCLANNFKLARTSNQPGKTRLINFYLFNEAFYLVDLPGYGFAGVSMDEKDKWAPMIESYLARCANLVMLVQVVDIRHKPTVDDMKMMNWIKHSGLKAMVVASKADKLARSALKKRIADIKEELGLWSDTDIIPFSANTGLGKEELLNIIEPHILG